MKKLLILFILSTFLLSGCGIYNLNLFTLPDDVEFLALIEELDTPEKICDYMQDNFTYKETTFYNLNPHNLWLIKEGDCGDFSTFGIFIANYHNYKTYYILIYFKDTSDYHQLSIFIENGKYTYSNNRFYHPLYALSFNEIVLDFLTYYSRELKSYKVYDYDNNLIKQVTNNGRSNNSCKFKEGVNKWQ